MGLLNGGRDHIAKLINGEAVTAYTNATAYIAVGDSSTAFSAAHTDLQAASNKLRKGMDATYPQRAANVITYRATFTTAEANWAWNEWGVANDVSAGVLLNRKVESLGTKASTQSWQFTVNVTIAAG